MKISEVVEKLLEIQKEHGDVDVEYDADFICEVQYVIYSEYSGTAFIS